MTSLATPPDRRRPRRSRSTCSSAPRTGQRASNLLRRCRRATCSTTTACTPRAASRWQATTGSLRLAHRDAVVRRSALRPRHAVRTNAATPARDRYGNWFWISRDRRRHRPPRSRRTPGHALVVARQPRPDGLAVRRRVRHRRRRAGQHAPTTLAGLAITTGHQLAAGLVDTTGGLLVFDLHASGAPLVLRWPGPRSVTPFDVAETARRRRARARQGPAHVVAPGPRLAVARRCQSPARRGVPAGRSSHTRRTPTPAVVHRRSPPEPRSAPPDRTG